MVAHACNLSSWEAGAEVQSQSGPHSSRPAWATEEDPISETKQLKTLGRVANACDPAIPEWEQEDPEFKNILIHIETLKSAWAAQGFPVLGGKGEKGGGGWKKLLLCWIAGFLFFVLFAF